MGDNWAAEHERAAVRLRRLISASMRAQGYRVRGGKLIAPRNITKDIARKLHSPAVAHKVALARPQLGRYESRLLTHFASIDQVADGEWDPQVVRVVSGSEDELLFRYACLHWSIPVSSGYGRRARFLVVDGRHRKLIGVIGLGDPVYSVGARDWWIGWREEVRRERLKHVMDAFVLGGVPPYSWVLGGKLAAMLAASNEVRVAVEEKYRDRAGTISGKAQSGKLALLTTTSALGRSSLYNRLAFAGQKLFEPVGMTQGSGEFHFANGLSDVMEEYAKAYCVPTERHANWGGRGFRNRREIIKKVLTDVGLTHDWVYHGVSRQVFAVQTASNSVEFLRGDTDVLTEYDRPAARLWIEFRRRWLAGRLDRLEVHRGWDPMDFGLWGSDE